MSGDVDACLASRPAAQRATLQALRAALRKVLPDAIECLRYAMPGFSQAGPNGKVIAGDATFTHHLGLYPHSGTAFPRLADDRKGCKTSKSGILFTPQPPLPDGLVHKIINTRLAELDTEYGKRPRC